MKQYVFFAHFNRVNMQRGKSRVWTLHFRGMCMQAEKIVFHVPLETAYKPKGVQPKATLRGKAGHVFASSSGHSLVVTP